MQREAPLSHPLKPKYMRREVSRQARKLASNPPHPMPHVSEPLPSITPFIINSLKCLKV